MAKFRPIIKNRGEIIKSEDWNKIQEDIQGDIKELERRLQILKDYVDNMEESTTMSNMDSPVGENFNLDEVIPGETSSYDAHIVGLLTKQWLLPKGKEGEICRFGIVAYLESMDYWSGADNGDKKTLEIAFNYFDGTSAIVKDLLVQDRKKLRNQDEQNPWLEYLLSPNEHVWYRYRVANPDPKKEVLNVSFKNTNPDCTPRIGNVIHLRSKIIPTKILFE